MGRSSIVNLNRTQAVGLPGGNQPSGWAPPPTATAGRLVLHENGLTSFVMTSKKKWDDFIAYMDQHMDVLCAAGGSDIDFYHGRYEKMKHARTRFNDPLSASDAAIYKVDPDDLVTGHGKKSKAARWGLKIGSALLSPGQAAQFGTEMTMRATGVLESKYFVMITTPNKYGGRGKIRGEKRCDLFYHATAPVTFAQVRSELNDHRMQYSGDGEVMLP
ncbi:MAG: hypothetical protein PGN09_05415 [Sphingomonas fennica]